MGVGDEGRGAARHHDAGELRRREQRAFDVNVRVDEPGQDEAARYVECLRGRPFVGAHPRDAAVRDRDVRRFDARGEDVDDPPSGQHQVGGLVAAGDADPAREQGSIRGGGA